MTIDSYRFVENFIHEAPFLPEVEQSNCLLLCMEAGIQSHLCTIVFVYNKS